MLATIIQWMIFLVSLSIYLVGATFNGLIGWRIWIRKDLDGPSVAPFISGLIGIVVVLSAPFGEMSDRVSYLWIPFLLDYGSGPYLLMVIFSFLKPRKKEKS